MPRKASQQHDPTHDRDGTLAEQCRLLPEAGDHQQRSAEVRRLVHTSDPVTPPVCGGPTVPATVVRFWQDLAALPWNVAACLHSWARPLRDAGLEIVIFDDDLARTFIAQRLGQRTRRAFDRCRHPAMRSELFRLCFLLVDGGVYIDADEKYLGGPLDRLAGGGTLKIHPLCYDSESGGMVNFECHTEPGAGAPTWIHYVNNNPLIAPPNHPVVRLSLLRAIHQLETVPREAHDVQAVTGPGNLTACLVSDAMRTERAGCARNFEFLRDWDEMSRSQWPLSYRNDDRNWRFWDPTA